MLNIEWAIIAFSIPQVREPKTSDARQSSDAHTLRG